jgi:hypothetical protein
MQAPSRKPVRASRPFQDLARSAYAPDPHRPEQTKGESSGLIDLGALLSGRAPDASCVRAPDADAATPHREKAAAPKPYRPRAPVVSIFGIVASLAMGLLLLRVGWRHSQPNTIHPTARESPSFVRTASTSTAFGVADRAATANDEPLPVTHAAARSETSSNPLRTAAIPSSFPRATPVRLRATTAPDKRAADPIPGGADSSTRSGVSLTDAIRDAVGSAPFPGLQQPAQPASTPPISDAQPGAAVVHPSQGQVASALSAVLPRARACFSPDDPISRARLVFASRGDVKSLEVTGYAAGKPAEPCLREALLGARVPPFTEATFEATVTIRP